MPKTSFPFFLIVGITLFIVVLIELALLFGVPNGIEWRTLTVKKPESIEKVQETHLLITEQKAEADAIKETRVNLPVRAYNPVIGAKNNAVSLVVFTDPDCGSCRARLRSLLENMADYRDMVQVTLKFIPENRDEFRGGIFMHVAWQAGVFPHYFEAVMAERAKISADRYVTLLEEAGMALDHQRGVMAAQMTQVIRQLQQDVLDAHALGLNRPNAYYLNGVRIGTPDYPLEKINRYILNILSGAPLKQGIEPLSQAH